LPAAYELPFFLPFLARAAPPPPPSTFSVPFFISLIEGDQHPIFSPATVSYTGPFFFVWRTACHAPLHWSTNRKPGQQYVDSFPPPGFTVSCPGCFFPDVCPSGFFSAVPYSSPCNLLTFTVFNPPPPPPPKCFVFSRVTSCPDSFGLTSPPRVCSDFSFSSGPLYKATMLFKSPTLFYSGVTPTPLVLLGQESAFFFLCFATLDFRGFPPLPHPLQHLLPPVPLF